MTSEILRDRRRPAWSCVVVVASAILASLHGGTAFGQLPPLPGTDPTATAPAESPAIPPDEPAAVVPTTPREAELERRVQQLEAMVRELSGRVQAVEAPPPVGGTSAGGPTEGPDLGRGSLDVTGPFGTVGAAEEPPPEEAPRINMPAPPRKAANLKGVFGNGFSWTTEDEEFQFQFHNLSQFDYRGYWDTPNTPLNQLYHSTFGIPRQWWIFSGRIGKPFEYFVVPAFGFDGINLLDAFLNIHYDDRLQFKVGRYKTPFTYEFYNLPINGLVNPERSLFFNNFGLNRDVGAMAWGQLFDKRLDYSVGLFNGSRNFYIDRNSSPDIAAYLNFRPFGKMEGSPLEFLNVGGSVLAGNQSNLPVPQLLRTNVATTGSSFYGVPFFGFNNDVVESGARALWDLHAAWYYRSLTLIGEWGSGFQDYAHLANTGARTRVPISGFYAQAGYFLTGETVASRGQVRPIRNFDLRPGKLGPGAIELAGRYSTLNLGQEVFTYGLADPNNWTRKAELLDVGVNWYWTQYLKVYFGWQHAMFNNPVLIEPGRYQLTNDMLWLRFQVYF